MGEFLGEGFLWGLRLLVEQGLGCSGIGFWGEEHELVVRKKLGEQEEEEEEEVESFT